MGSSSIKEPFSVDFASRELPISLFQMLRDVITAGGGGWPDEGCCGWKMGGWGDVFWRLDSKIH